jgi:hypothetical protein
MRILRRVTPLEVKRTFVLADHLTERKGKGNNRKFLKKISEKEFQRKLCVAKKLILEKTEEQLDRLVSPEWPRRLEAYNNSAWHVAEMHPSELGVWVRAGDLPLRWTNDSLKETARRVAAGFKKKSKLLKNRPKHSIPNILTLQTHRNQEEKYLYPIVFKTDTGTKGRRRLKRKMKGDIDDGCMRSIALTMSGRDPVLVYFGSPKTTD